MIQKEYRVALGDTDAAGRIFFATPPRWFHGLLEDYLVTKNLPLAQLLKGEFQSPIVHMEFDFKISLQLGDVVTLKIPKIQVSEKSFTVLYEAFRGQTLAVSGKITHVTVDSQSGKVIAIPQRLRDVLALNS